jgi:hypothetical protein
MTYFEVCAGVRIKWDMELMETDKFDLRLSVTLHVIALPVSNLGCVDRHHALFVLYIIFF